MILLGFFALKSLSLVIGRLLPAETAMIEKTCDEQKEAKEADAFDKDAKKLLSYEILHHCAEYGTGSKPLQSGIPAHDESAVRFLPRVVPTPPPDRLSA
ncbi:MAG: hypothetical protein INR69_05340 [Mucilaginibacter polytrichastri]|nr:hypothetical protein [Mucilaginibacter polytrichastri]